MPETKHLGIFDHLSDSKKAQKLLERGIVEHVIAIPSHLVDKLHNCVHVWSDTGSVWSKKVCAYCGVSTGMFENWLKHCQWLETNKYNRKVFINLHARLSIVNGEFEEMEAKRGDAIVQKYKRAYTPERWAQWWFECDAIGIFTVGKYPPLEPNDFQCEHGHYLNEHTFTEELEEG